MTRQLKLTIWSYYQSVSWQYIYIIGEQYAWKVWVFTFNLKEQEDSSNDDHNKCTCMKVTEIHSEAPF